MKKRKRGALGKIFYRIGKSIRNLFNYGVPLKAVILLLVVFTGAAIGITYSKLMKNVGGKEDYAEAMRYIELKDVLEERYISDVDRGAMADSASAAIVAGLGDKWSYYMTADEYGTYQMSSANAYADIGISIIKDEGTGGFKIESVNYDSAAARAGLAQGMIIVEVDGTDVTQLDYDKTRTLIRSKMNVKFPVVVSSGETYEVDCTGGYVSAVSYRKEKTEAGYVQIKNFEAGTGNDCVSAVEDLLNQGIIALVIDVRGNPGGLVEEARTFLDYLLPEGTLFVEVDKQGNETEITSDPVCLDIPTVVLINGDTYSEAEIFAAALQEFSAALLMGEPTPGMTRIQEVVELSDGSAIRLSTKSFLTANRTDIAVQGGVIPDQIVYNSDPSTVGTTEGTTGESTGTASTSNDEALMAALTYLSKSQF